MGSTARSAITALPASRGFPRIELYQSEAELKDVHS